MKADYLIRTNALFDSVNEKPYKASVAVVGNKIAKVITGDDTEFVGDDTKILDYGDKMVMAGFVDAHDHFFDGAITSSEHMLDLIPSKSEEQAVEMLKEYRATHPDEKRIRGYGWFPAIWGDAPLPSCKSLDEAFPDIPVYCIAADFHTFWCNSLALEEAGYTPESTFEGGSLGKFEDGSLNGLIFEPGAFVAAKWKAYEFSLEENKENMTGFIKQVVECGVTSVSDMGATDFLGGEPNPLAALQELTEEGKLDCRVHIYSNLMAHDTFEETKAFADANSNDMVQISGVKGFVDGVTSTYTALLLEPYEDKPETCGDGAPIMDYEKFAAKTAAANAAGLPVRVHCIGDGAVRYMLDAFENSNNVNGRHGLKNTIEHIEIIDPSDIPRFAEQDVIASIQPQHLPLDEFEKSTRCGEERAKWQWAVRSLIDAGCEVAFGTDYPVVGFNPYPSLHSAVTRCFADGKPCSTNPEQAITLFESLVAYTLNSADVYGRAHELGSIEEGKLADIIAVDRNLFEIPEQEIKDAKTIMTMVDGRIVFEA